jgi:hypothetical protein
LRFGTFLQWSCVSRVSISQYIIVVERINQLINPIHIQFRFVLPADGVITVLPHCYSCYSYGIILLPW